VRTVYELVRLTLRGTTGYRGGKGWVASALRRISRALRQLRPARFRASGSAPRLASDSETEGE
jgi:hypothetical protein